MRLSALFVAIVSTFSITKAQDPVVTDSARLMQAVAKGYRYLKINLDSSYHYALETFPLAASVKPTTKVYALNLQGDVLLKLGNAEKALDLFKEGVNIRLSESAPYDSGSLSYLYNQIGDTYWQLHDTLAALPYYRQSMQWTARYTYDHPLHEEICSRLCNMGWYYLRRNRLDSAEWYARRSAEVGDKISAITDLFWGDIELEKQNTTKALEYFRSAIKLGRRHDRDLEIVLQAYDRMVITFESLHLPDSSLIYARRSIETASGLHDIAAISRTGTMLANMFVKRRQLDSAIHYQQLVLDYTRRQFNQEKERQTLNVYFNEKIKEQTFASERKEYRTRLWLFGLSGAMAVVILAALLYRAKLKSRYERQLKALEMRALRAQMNPHFIFNCLGSINRYIVKSDTRTASSYLTKFAKLIRLILDNSANDHISLETEIQTLQLYLDMESLRFDQGFDYEILKEDIAESEHLQVPSMLIQPYVENAIWHGLLHKDEKGKLWIRFRRINGHMLQAEIEDNGIGRKNAATLKSKSAVKQKSYGMQISHDRIQIINNVYNLNNSVTVQDLVDEAGNAAGTKVILNIPVT